MRRELLLLLPPLAGCLHHGGGPAATGPRHDTLRLYRAFADADKVYVLADPGDGVQRAFMVDTGASISVVTPDVASALGLEVSSHGDKLIGLGGRTDWRRSTLSHLRLGAYDVPEVEVAVGVPGVPTTAGLAPVAGILGNNVWGRFELAVDYRANELELARPGELPVPADAMPMTFNGQHVSTAVSLVVGPADAPVRQDLLLELDTGAHGIVISGSQGEMFRPVTTEGEEVILGVGAGDDVPVASFVRTTRRAPVHQVGIGGTKLDRELSLTWINYDQDRPAVGPPEMKGLVGFDVFEGNRVIFDYPGGRLSVKPSDQPAHFYDLHELMLRDLRRAKTLDELRQKARVLAVLGREEDSDAVIATVLERAPKDPEVTVLRARIARTHGEVAAALTMLRALSAGDLVDQGEIVGTVNGLWLAGEPEAARSLAEAAVAAKPEVSDAWIAASDARRVAGDLDGAREALRAANRIDELPEGHLLRRAWLASLSGDTLAAMTYARRLLDRSPTWGATLWLYGLEAARSGETALLGGDLDRALGRLHPGDRPLDFAALAWRLAGDTERARALAAEGTQRDCESPKVDSATKANCEAWYLAMEGRDLERARAQVEAAIAAKPDRSDYLDTEATVYEALGMYAEARDVAWHAASLSPDDVYLLWQAGRLDARARAGG